MLSKVKSILMGLLSMIAALFFVRSKVQERKADKAEIKANQAERKAQAQAAEKKVMRDIAEAQSAARESNEKAKAKRNAKPDSERRTGQFGTADRLR